LVREKKTFGDKRSKTNVVKNNTTSKSEEASIGREKKVERRRGKRGCREGEQTQGIQARGKATTEKQICVEHTVLTARKGEQARASIGRKIIGGVWDKKKKVGKEA